MFKMRIRTESAKFTRIMLNLWPPLFFSGIRILELSNDFRYMRATLKDWSGTRNVHGAQFGGSLFALTDASYSAMLNGMIGKRYYVWDKAAHIDFIKPGRGAVFIECRITDEMLHDIYENTKNGEKYLPEIPVRVFDKNGETVALAKRMLYIRLKPTFRPKTAKSEAEAETVK